MANFGAGKVLLLKVSAPDNVAAVPVVGKVKVVSPLVEKVKEFDPMSKVLELAMVRVPVEVVMVNPS